MRPVCCPHPCSSPGGATPAGSLSYPPGAADQAAAILELLDHKTPLRYIAIVLFARGFHVDEDRLKAAYVQVLDDIQAHGADEDGLGDGADHLAQQLRRRAKRIPVARRWVARAGTYGARRNSPLEDGLVALTTALICGEQPDEQAGNAIMQIVGGPVDADVDVMGRLALTTLPALREALRELTPGELVRARALLERSLNVVMRLQRLTLAVTGELVADGLEDWELVNELGKAVSILSMAAVLRKLPDTSRHWNSLRALWNKPPRSVLGG